MRRYFPTGRREEHATLEQLELLSTENHLMDTYERLFGVIASA